MNRRQFLVGAAGLSVMANVRPQVIPRVENVIVNPYRFGGAGDGITFGLSFIGADYDAGNSSPTLSVSTTSSSDWLIVVLAAVATGIGGALLINGSAAPSPIAIRDFSGFLRTVVYAIPGNVSAVTTSGQSYSNGSALLAVYRLHQDSGVAISSAYDSTNGLDDVDAWDLISVTPDAGGCVLGVVNTRNESSAFNPGLFGTVDENRLDYNTDDTIRLFHLNNADNQAYAMTDPTVGNAAAGQGILVAFNPV